MAHQARKRFGQHFLVDVGVIDAIVRSIGVQRDETVIEIGPGLSALTAPLLEALDHLTVVQSDALKVDFSTLGDKLRVVGNLPYNISSPLLFHLIAHAEHIVDQHFMLQREVIDRMVAQPSSSDYGRLSVMLQSRYRMEKLFDVPPEAFDPPPRVVSAVVRMVPAQATEPKRLRIGGGASIRSAS
jgi:16S rRNA (adenine1518-N6/adenine1519-N6)-dimethyltransferase